jgi:nicotinamidase-related amidase
VIVDMQVDFCASEGALYAEGSAAVIDPVVAFAHCVAAAVQRSTSAPD